MKRERRHSPIFDGRDGLRLRGEWSVLWWSLGIALLAAPLLAFIFPQLRSLREVALLLVAAMIYVTFARGRLLGGAIRVHPGQFGSVYDIALECSRALRMNVPSVFVRDDPFVPIVAVGIGEPYSLVLSAQWVEHLTDGELRFLVGRELAHIEAGHTRLTSLLSINGRENPLVSIVFGVWLRRIEYTADRAGLLCCASLDDALTAISVSSFHLVGRKIDLRAFAEQQRELELERSLRVGEWVSATPYATKRIAALQTFARDGLFLRWNPRFDSARSVPVTAPLLPPGAVPRNTFASLPRRAAAWMIDATLVSAIVPSVAVATSSEIDDRIAALTAAFGHLSVGELLSRSGAVDYLALLVYTLVSVALTGQTFGMMIVDLRVVNERFGSVGFGHAFWRYACMVASFVGLVGFLRLFSRVQPYEKWSRTRLIGGSAYARLREQLTMPSLAAASSPYRLRG